MAIRPTFLAFQTASRALAASQANIDVTGNNIANVNTPGYTRQRVDQTSISAGGYTQKYALSGISTGFGVNISGITQIRDPFLDARYREQSAESARYDTILQGLFDLEGVFDEASTPGLMGEFESFVEALQTLSQTPSAPDIALIARTAAQKVTQIMNVYATQVNQVREQQMFDLSRVLIENNFNTKVKGIADLNDQIRKEQTYGNVPNELYDRRNLLIDELSEMANIRVSVLPENISEDIVVERLTISLHDPRDGSSVSLIDGGLHNFLYTEVEDGRIFIGIASSFDAPADNDITDQIAGGSIRGYLDLINGTGLNEFRGAPYYLDAIDDLAANFARVFNELNRSGGVDKPLFSTSDGSGTVTAANIRISDEWLDDASYITTTHLDGDGGENVIRMISSLEGETVFYKNGDVALPTVFSGSFHDYLSGLIGEVALDAELYQNYSDTSANVQNGLFAARESMSGVSLNEEGINLMAYQKSYNAAMRYFTVLDEAVDAIINRMGLVGR